MSEASIISHHWSLTPHRVERAFGPAQKGETVEEWLGDLPTLDGLGFVRLTPFGEFAFRRRDTKPHPGSAVIDNPLPLVALWRRSSTLGSTIRRAPEIRAYILYKI